jgi:putative intracellular protease/amidase
MKVGILVYDGCVQFEVILAAFFIQQKGQIVTFGLEERNFRSAEGFHLRPERHISTMDTDDVDAFIIPGGVPDPLLGDPVLRDVLVSLNGKGKLLAAICAAPLHLSLAGVLEGKRFTSSLYHERKELFTSGSFEDKDVVVDSNVITAWPNAYVDFAMAIGDRLDLFEDDNDRAETIRVFREFRRC